MEAKNEGPLQISVIPTTSTRTCFVVVTFATAVLSFGHGHLEVRETLEFQTRHILALFALMAFLMKRRVSLIRWLPLPFGKVMEHSLPTPNQMGLIWHVRAPQGQLYAKVQKANSPWGSGPACQQHCREQHSFHNVLCMVPLQILCLALSQLLSLVICVHLSNLLMS